jgi:DNA primase
MNTTQQTIILVESEKTCVLSDYFLSGGIWIATGGNNGLSERVIHEIMPTMRGREFVLIPDADLAGREAYVKAYDYLMLYAAEYGFSVRYADLWPELEDGYDLADYILTNAAQLQRGIFSSIFNAKNTIKNTIDTREISTFVPEPQAPQEPKCRCGAMLQPICFECGAKNMHVQYEYEPLPF